MEQIGLAEVKAKLSSLIRRVEAGEEILITLHDRPVAALVPASRLMRPDTISPGMYSASSPVAPTVVREFSSATYSAFGKDHRLLENPGSNTHRGDRAPADPVEAKRENTLEENREMIEKTTHFLLTLKPEERISLLEDALAALAEREAAHSLIAMMGSDPDAMDIPRRR